MTNRDPELGQPVGKGDPGAQPILLAKLSKNQEIEIVCKAYKVGPKHRCMREQSERSAAPA